MESTMLAMVLCLVIPSFTMVSGEIRLSLMEQSIDDMYRNCESAMEAKVMGVYFPRENKTQPFKDGWKLAKSPAKRKYDQQPTKILTLDQCQAIFTYSQQFPDVYERFNTINRDGAKIYGTIKYDYHSLHFWLTTALQRLNPNKQCHTTYRRTKVKITGKVNQEMRFGSFASSSTDPDLGTFGTESCFYIETCYGANIEKYSRLGESEVLIPPYEKFKVIDIAEKSYKEFKDCKKIFVLKNADKLSKLNCKAD
ncbi:unnamed protein product [Knipowitschia caucasica]|uniref:NAD(P)(+)--arginine ADP-ribosyltransferase n=1 Tax=Knipowitschia caucasica TaxID=637954 RepID=A0AAV2KR68_KNICA